MRQSRGIGPGVIMRRGMSRRDFLKVGGVGLAGAALLGTTACGGGGQEQGGGPARIILSHGPEESGTLQKQVDAFNEQHQGEIELEWREMPSQTQQYFDQLRTQFQAGGGDIDVISGDVIWPAQFAANGWISDLSDRFTEDMREEFLQGTIESNTYEGAIYGVPWFTDAGMLYYRSDLLEGAGMEPPQTWQELQEMAIQISQEQNIRNGFVFQGSNYEGGVVNGLEYIWTHGGSVLEEGTSDRVIIDSPESVAGLETERSMIESGAAPRAVINWTEMESHTAFLNGDAVFIRNWPYMYGLAGDPETSRIEQDQLGVAPLPVSQGGAQSASGLGGWNLFVNAQTENPDAAWTVIEFLAAPEQAKQRALEGGFLPAREALYNDEEILNQVPVVELGAEALQNVRSRPVSPYYSDMSLVMAEQFNASLSGTTSPQEAVSTLQTELSDITQQEG